MSAAVSRWGRMGAWISDRVNPIVVKEVRQGVKSRQFAVAFMVLLLVCLLICAIAGAHALDRPQEPCGMETFAALGIALLAVTLVWVPMASFHSLRGEYQEQTYGLLSLTALRPRQIISGKLFATLGQLALYVSAIAPFLAFAYFLRGIDVPTVGFSIAAAILLSIALCILALLFASVARSRFMVWLLQLMTLGAGGWTFGGLWSFAAWTALRGRPLFDFRDPDFWLGVGIALSLLAGVCTLLFVLTVAQLSPAASNRATGPRLALALNLAMALGWCLYVRSVSPSDDDPWIALGVVGLILWTIAGIYAVGEPIVLSARVRNAFPRLYLVGPLFALFFYPGRGRGALYFVSMLVLTLAAATGGALGARASADDEVATMWAAAGYAVFYLAAPAALARRIFKARATPPVQRAFVLISMMAGVLLPPLIGIYLVRARDLFHQFVWVLAPSPWAIGFVDRSDEAAGCAIAAGAIGLGILVPSMLQAVRETSTLCRTARSRGSPASAPGAAPAPDAA